LSKVAFFVQNNFVGKLTIPVAKFAMDRCIDLIDRSSSNTLNVDSVEVEWSAYENVLIFGSAQFMRLCKDSALHKYVHHDEFSFAISNWSKKLRGYALNGSGSVISCKDVAEKLKESSVSMHVRPNIVDKAFNGGLFSAKDWMILQDNKCLHKDLMCWISPPAVIHEEYRCWIVKNEVIEISRYRKGGEMDVVRCEDVAVWNASEELANIYMPNQCCVMDVAKTDEGWNVIEFNPIHCSGWYAANVSKILDSYLRCKVV
jgi:hypothetical protein